MKRLIVCVITSTFFVLPALGQEISVKCLDKNNQYIYTTDLNECVEHRSFSTKKRVVRKIQPISKPSFRVSDGIVSKIPNDNSANAISEASKSDFEVAKRGSAARLAARIKKIEKIQPKTSRIKDIINGTTTNIANMPNKALSSDKLTRIKIARKYEHPDIGLKERGTNGEIISNCMNYPTEENQLKCKKLKNEMVKDLERRLKSLAPSKEFTKPETVYVRKCDDMLDSRFKDCPDGIYKRVDDLDGERGLTDFARDLKNAVSPPSESSTPSSGVTRDSYIKK